MEFQNTITINCPQQVLFNYLAQPEHVPEWNYAISKTEQIGEGKVGVGTKFRQFRTVPRPAEERFEVTEFEAPTRFAIQGDLGPFNGTVRYILRALSVRSTELTNEADLKVPLSLRLASPLLTHQVRSAVAANLVVLKGIMERA